MSRRLLTLQRNKTARPPAAIRAVSDQAGRHARADDHVDRMGIGPVTKPGPFGLARWRKRIGATAKIRRSDAKKIPIVDASDPQKPVARKPAKMDAIRTGPGLSMTTATATRNSLPFRHGEVATAMDDQRDHPRADAVEDRRHPGEAAKMGVGRGSAATIRKFGSMNALPPTHAPQSPPRSYEIKGRLPLAWQKSKEIG